MAILKRMKSHSVPLRDIKSIYEQPRSAREQLSGKRSAKNVSFKEDVTVYSGDFSKVIGFNKVKKSVSRLKTSASLLSERKRSVHFREPPARPVTYEAPRQIENTARNDGDWIVRPTKSAFKMYRNQYLKKRHMMHISGRMTAGGMDDPAPCMCTPSEDVSLPKSRPQTPPVVVCEKCGGYSYSGQTCPADGEEHVKPVRSELSPFPCCPCCMGEFEKKKLKKKAFDDTRMGNNPLIGPHADKILPFFQSGNIKARMPAIVGYGKDGNPLYGPSTTVPNVIGYNANGTPIVTPGSGGPFDKGLVMGYTKDGKPIRPPPNLPPKDAMTIIGSYVKDNSPIVGSNKLLGGMIIRGQTKDGFPKYIAAPANKLVKKVIRKDEAVEEKPKPKPGLRKGSRLARDIRNFYPRCKYHPKCVPVVDRVPAKMSWTYKTQPRECDNGHLPFWIPPCYKPGAVPFGIACKIKKDRKGRPMRSPYAGMNFRKCFCPKCDCICNACSQRKIERKLKKKFQLPDAAFD